MCSLKSSHRSATILALWLAVVLALPAAAQPTQTLLIRDGDVYINGRLVPPDELPEGLDTWGVEARFSVTGDATPVFSIGQGLYKLVDGRLLPADDPAAGDDPAADASGVSVFFRDPAGAPAARRDPLADRAGTRAAVTPDDVYAVRLQQRLVELQQQAQALQRQSAHAPDPLLVQEFDRLIRQFEQVVESSPGAPELQQRRYLDEVQQHDQELYGRLVQEWQMERETHRLADSIGRLPAGPQREAQIGQLRDLLDQIFELKQENRRAEIAALKARLAEAQERLEQREALRSTIIDHRLRQLIGVPEQKE
ncbi:hypothetical protein AWN76_005695 [Rhodothermaceae bacterium RA]|nr:hypothetical protein AWN76_005695 [Rhodothermaceae bacterium RA]